MTILGIDPGSLHLGLSLLEKDAGRVRFKTSERINLGNGDLVDRMKLLLDRLDVFLKEHAVDSAAIEEGFLGKNVKTVEVLARIRGLVMTVMIQHGIPFSSYTPRTIKMAVTGYGNADKEQVRKGLAIILGTRTQGLSDDESDALAIAYCHSLKG